MLESSKKLILLIPLFLIIIAAISFLFFLNQSYDLRNRAAGRSSISRPISYLSCQTCLSENRKSLCLDIKRKMSFCSSRVDTARDPNTICVSCGISSQSPTPHVKSVSPNLAVSKGMGTSWFDGWAKKNDLLVYFGEGLNFQTIVKPKLGKVAWNVPSFAQVMESYPNWKDKVDVVIYDYEKWTKTPIEEQNDPEGTAKKAQSFIDQRGKELIFGTSWRMAVQGLSADQIRSSQGKIDWDSYLDKDRIGKIVANVKNYGVNATGLRAELPDAYIGFFNAISAYAISVNPNINLWPVLDARNQIAKEMYQMYQNFKGNTKGLIIMGTNSETNVVEEFLQLIRK